MAEIIFEDGAKIEFANGRFDKWCVYYTNKDGERFPPHDIDYFEGLLTLAEDCGINTVYEDFVEVFCIVDKDFKVESQEFIRQLSIKYSDKLFAEKIFCIFYMTMIAEENKAFSILGKRIKRLGVHRLLFEGLSLEEATTFMKGKPWRELDAMCKERGF